MGRKKKNVSGKALIAIIDKDNKALSRGELLSKMYGRIIPETLADKICYPEDGEHHHLWYEVYTFDEENAYKSTVELCCGCGKRIRYASNLYSELLLQIVEDFAVATTKEQLDWIKASVPKQVIDDAWELTSNKTRKHCYQLCGLR